jgi:hypothetical protein
MLSGNGAGAQSSTCPSTPYKWFEDWNFCHTHGGNVNNAHTSAMCGNPGLTHNPNKCANIMGRLVARMHKTILPSASDRTHPPSCCPQQQQLQQQGSMQGTTWQHVTHLAQFGGMPTIGGNYLPAYYHGHASLARSAHDDLFWPKPGRCWARTNDAVDAARPTADGDAHDVALLCPLHHRTKKGWY